MSGELVGDVASGNCVVRLQRRSGAILRFPKLDLLYDGRTHSRFALRICKTQFDPLANAAAARVYRAILALCPGQDDPPEQEARQWLVDFIGDLADIIDADLTKDGFEPFADRERRQKKLWTVGRAVAIRDEKEQLWLPASALRAHIGERLEFSTLTARLKEVGWRREPVDKWEPGKPRDVARRVHRLFYVGLEPDGLEADE